MALKIGLLVFNLLSLTLNLNAEIHYDTNFKSIHQLQSEQHAKDTVKISNFELKDKTELKNVINFSSVVIIIIIFIITISIFLIARRIYRTKKQ